MSPPDKSAYLSKSLYTRGLQCHKSLYLHKYQPELRGEPTPELEALWKSGHEVGDFAHMLFPGGVIVPFDGLTKDEQLAKTREEIDRGTKAIYEATFSFDDVFVKADIIVRNRGYWDLYEVKSSTSVKEHHWDDVAVQYYVLSGCGLPINKAYLVHINNGYVRDGDIVPEELFVLQDITGIVKEKQASIPEELAEMRAMLRGKVPKIDIGPHCEDPYPCDFMDHCWQHVPEHSVFSLRGRGIDQWELYRQGVIKLQDVPLDSLNLMQRMQAEYFLDRKSHADPAKIREFLKKVRYPVCFLDFETFGSGIPLFDGTRPYQQVPFQYSLHRIDAEGEEARHFEYLAQPGVDPRKEIAEERWSRDPRRGVRDRLQHGFRETGAEGTGGIHPDPPQTPERGHRGDDRPDGAVQEAGHLRLADERIVLAEIRPAGPRAGDDVQRSGDQRRGDGVGGVLHHGNHRGPCGAVPAAQGVAGILQTGHLGARPSAGEDAGHGGGGW